MLAGSATFLPPIWLIVLKTSLAPTPAMKGNTAVYFFLTKVSDAFYIFLADLAAKVFFFIWRLGGNLRLGENRFLKGIFLTNNSLRLNHANNFKPSLQCVYQLLSFVFVELFYSVVACDYELLVIQLHVCTFDFASFRVLVSPYLHIVA